METEQKFKTKTGFCHILPDRIVLTHDGFEGNVAEVVVNTKRSWFFIVYTLVALLMIYNAYSDFVKGNWFFFGLYVVTIIFISFSIIKSRNHSAIPVIARNMIKKIEFKPARKFLTRAYFKVSFEEKDGKVKIRFIMLPGSLSDGPKKTRKAVEIMRSNGLLFEQEKI